MKAPSFPKSMSLIKALSNLSSSIFLAVIYGRQDQDLFIIQWKKSGHFYIIRPFSPSRRSDVKVQFRLLDATGEFDPVIGVLEATTAH